MCHIWDYGVPGQLKHESILKRNKFSCSDSSLDTGSSLLLKRARSCWSMFTISEEWGFLTAWESLQIFHMPAVLQIHWIKVNEFQSKGFDFNQ